MGLMRCVMDAPHGRGLMGPIAAQTSLRCKPVYGAAVVTVCNVTLCNS